MDKLQCETAEPQSTEGDRGSQPPLPGPSLKDKGQEVSRLQ